MDTLTVECANETELTLVQAVLDDHRRKESEKLIANHRREDKIRRRYKALHNMYNSEEALLTRAAVAQMCATHNV